jgi:sodium transport system permease protein
MISLITRRELRDLLRDRRTLFIVLILPALLYPVFGLVGFFFALTSLQQHLVIGVVGSDYLPQPAQHPEAMLAGGLLLAECERRLDDPPLLANGRFLAAYAQRPGLDADEETPNDGLRVVLLSDQAGALASRQVDALLVIPADFREKLKSQHERPVVEILGRDGDETSKLAVRRLGTIVNRYQRKLKDVRFARRGLPPDFDEPMQIEDPQESKPVVVKTADELRDMLAKCFPFLLVMWTMAGALHPAIDLTAGEKERGTMETLLISPAERREIVAGKFAAVWLFSYVSALCNLFWMGGAAFALSWVLPAPIVSVRGLVWAALFAAPLAALFSAVAIGLGVFARSSKEGQYYLMPLFLLVMPLCLWSMSPGLKLTLPVSLVPITGLTLLLQRLMSVSAEPPPPLCEAGVAVSLLLCVVLSLWWASWQFRRESVLFREAERLSLKGWLRSLFK